MTTKSLQNRLLQLEARVVRANDRFASRVQGRERQESLGQLHRQLVETREELRARGVDKPVKLERRQARRRAQVVQLGA